MKQTKNTTQIKNLKQSTHTKHEGKAIFLAILAAAIYALNSPISKLLLDKLPAVMMAGLLYLGAGIGLLIVALFRKLFKIPNSETSLNKSDIPFTLAMIVLDMAAPTFLMIGLTMTTAANASLLNNFEIVATSLIALFIFKEAISWRLWIGIILVTIASFILSVEDLSSFSFSYGSIFVLLACICWGIENNCTRKLSKRDPLQVVIVNGFCSGIGTLIIAAFKGDITFSISYILLALLLGFLTYGLSIYLYIYAQRFLGAAKTSAYYSVTPFIGATLSLIIFREMPSISFIVALIIMIAGTYFTSTDSRT